jgi:hypothetical protein
MAVVRIYAHGAFMNRVKLQARLKLAGKMRSLSVCGVTIR